MHWSQSNVKPQQDTCSVTICYAPAEILVLVARLYKIRSTLCECVEGFKTLDVIDLSATLNSSKHQVALCSICKWCVPYTLAFVWSVWRMVFIKKVLVSSKAVAS